MQFSLTHFLQKFRESNVFTKEITKELISRNFFSVRENFSFFLNCALTHWQTFRESNVFTKEITKELI